MTQYQTEMKKQRKSKKFFMIKEIIFFRPEKDYYKPVKIGSAFLVAIILSVKVMETKIKHYQLKIILMK